jgi:two-component system cell cycle sensor histidine kinase/response regulator CckA
VPEPSQTDATARADEIARLRRRLAALEAAEQATPVASRALIESERRFHGLIHDLEVGVLVLGPKGEVLVSNPAAVALLGLSRDQLLGKAAVDPDWQVVREDGTPYATQEQPVPLAIATREPVRDVVLGVHRPETGDRVWVLADALPQLDEEGAVVQVLCTLRDITTHRGEQLTLARMKEQLEARVEARTSELSQTVVHLKEEMAERVRAERALQESEERYRTLISSLAEGVLLVRANGSIEAANTAAERVLGRGLPQLREWTLVEPHWNAVQADGTPYPAEDQPAVRTLRTGLPLRDEILGLQEEGGATTWLLINTEPLFHEGQVTPHSVVVSFSDITERKRTEDALRQSRARLEGLTNAVPGAVYEHVRDADGDDRFTFISAGGAGFLGHSVEALLGDARRFFDAIDPEHRDRVQGALDEAGLKHGDIAIEFPYQPPRAEPRWLRMTARTFSRRGGEIAFNGVLQDITLDRAMEEAFRRSQKMDAVGDLAAGVAHNFNNMLAGILPNLEYALDHPHLRRTDDEEVEELRSALDDAVRASRSATEIVQQLMAFTRKDARRTRGSVRLEEPILDAVRVCRRTFDRRIDLAVELPEDKVGASPLAVFGHTSELQQVVLNLLLNARDAVADREGPRIAIRVRRVELPQLDSRLTHLEPRPHAVVEVEDNGCGIPEDVLERVGEPFFTTKGPAQGSGLGLASAFGIVRDHMGWMGCESEVGVGTTFRIALPLLQRAEAPARPQSEMPKKVRAQRRVLLVDDERLVRRSYTRLLKQLGHEVEAVGEGAAAVERFRQHPGRYDAIFLDLSMPEMSGAEVLAEIRRLDRDIPVVILTGYAGTPADLVDADALLTKPARRPELQRVLARLFEPEG